MLYWAGISCSLCLCRCCCFTSAYCNCYLLSICDIFAADFDVIFNAQKTKYIFFDSAVSKSSCPLPTFYVGNNVIEYVDCWPHLGHILSNNVKCDNDDIKGCNLSLVEQIKYSITVLPT